MVKEDKTKSNKDSLTGRKEFQAAEKYPEVKDDLDKSRFQDTKQVASAPETMSSASTVEGDKASASSVLASVARDVKKEMSISPNSDVEILDGKQVGGVPLGSSALFRSAAGTERVTSVDDLSRTSYTKGGSRPDSRYGKKNTVPNFIIDNAVSEQLAPHFVEVPNLRDDPDSEVGFNGNKQYTVARGKKNAGVIPQNILFDRSVDFDHQSYIVHTTGQVLDSIDGVANASYPTKTQNAVMADTGATSDSLGYYDISTEKQMHKSNFFLKSFQFTLDANGHIRDPKFNEVRINSHAGYAEKEEGNTNWLLDVNNVTHSVLRLQTELGRETSEKWSPLGYVIEDPFQYNMLAHDMEAITGAVMGMAYRSAAYSLAFQLNMLSKDGAKPINPMFRAFQDGIRKQVDSSYYDTLTTYSDVLFTNRDHTNEASCLYNAGSAAAMISMFDSTTKYTTKADILNQQRSLKMWLQSADNNINPLHAKKEFFKAVDDVTYFSTVDGTYNPMLPIHVTDRVRIINPMPLNYFLQGWTRPPAFDGVNTGTVEQFTYSYDDLRNKYTWTLKHPLVEGLLRWMLQHEGNLVKAYGTNKTIVWPCTFDMTTFNMFAFVLCAASYDVNYMRNIFFRDLLFAGDQSTYIWDDLTSLTDINPLHSSQLTYVDYGSPLKLGKLNVTSVLREYWPETYYPRRNSDAADTNDYILPWMLSEASAQSYSTGFEFKNSKSPNNFNYPSRRSGVNNSLFDEVYSLKPKDLLLAIDRPLRCPYMTSSSTASYTGEKIYSADSDQSGVKLVGMRYDVQSDGRLIEVIPSASDAKKIVYASIYEIPRQFGYIFPDMNCFGDGLYSGTTALTPDAKNLLDGVLDTTQYRYLESFKALGSLSDGGIASQEITRTAGLQQVWYRCFARRDGTVATSANYTYEDQIGIIPCFSGLITATKLATDAAMSTQDAVAKVVWPLNGSGDTTLTTNKDVITLSRYFWSSIQRIYFNVNPFEGCFDANTSAYTDIPSVAPVVDNMEMASYFGFAGFKAADYNQLVLNRLTIIDQLNVSYVKDTFLSASLIFRES